MTPDRFPHLCPPEFSTCIHRLKTHRAWQAAATGLYLLHPQTHRIKKKRPPSRAQRESGGLRIKAMTLNIRRAIHPTQGTPVRRIGQ